MDTEKDFAKIEEVISINFKNKKLLKQVFVHRSYLNENPAFALEHNERMEFLGDAVLELVVTEYLYKNYRNPEGELTTWRSALVKGEMLSKISQEIGLGDYLFLSRGEAKSGGKARLLILANVFEALIGAIYLDQGYDISAQFITRFLIVHLPEIIEKRLFQDPKSTLQEWAQDLHSVTPSYKVLKEEGPDHNKSFSMGVYLDENEIGVGSGASKQKAEQEAAKDALIKLKIIVDYQA